MRLIPFINEFNLDIGRVDYEPCEFRRVLLQHGMPLKWEYSLICPCRRVQDRDYVQEASDEPRANCPACYGSGMLHSGGQDTIGLLHDVKESAKFSTPFGQYTEGDLLCSMPPEHTPDRNDRLTLKAGARVLNEVRQRSAGPVERLRYPVLRRVFPVGNADSSPGSTVLELGVAYMRATDADGNVSGTVLLEGVDFTITDVGAIDWTIGDTATTSPPAGAWYTVRYYARPVFTIVGFPFLRRDTFTQAWGAAAETFDYLPVLVHLRPEFLGHAPEPDVTPNPDTYPLYAS